MSTREHNHRLDYVEFTSEDPASSRLFFETVFGWRFEDYGPNYTSFNDGRLTGGFEKGECPTHNSPLVVLYAVDLEATREAITAAAGEITREIFSFPGGRRFHFREPGGNELALWSDPQP